MRVKLNVTVEVDTEGWALEYGVQGAAAIRQDVSAYIFNTIAECNDNLTVVRSA